ncbi:MAG: hypothetical protein ACKO8I_16305, partial [Cyanobacteriota bacterium]
LSWTEQIRVELSRSEQFGPGSAGGLQTPEPVVAMDQVPLWGGGAPQPLGHDWLWRLQSPG